MRNRIAATLILVGVVGLLAQHYNLSLSVPWFGRSAVGEVVVVEESADRSLLPQSKIAVLTSPAVRKAAKEVGVTFHVVDLNDVDASGTTTSELKPFIEAAVDAKILPAWVERNARGSYTAKPLPANEQEAIACLSTR